MRILGTIAVVVIILGFALSMWSLLVSGNSLS
jgi:hypothetical protein